MVEGERSHHCANPATYIDSKCFLVIDKPNSPNVQVNLQLPDLNFKTNKVVISVVDIVIIK